MVLAWPAMDLAFICIGPVLFTALEYNPLCFVIFRSPLMPTLVLVP